MARYLLKFPEVEFHYPWRYDEELETVDVYTDSDWAGCRATRKSTSGGIVMIGGGIIKTWPKTQGPVALSGGEAEDYSMVKGTVEGIGLQTLAKDLGWSVGLRLFVDSSAAKAIASRKGLGKVRHLVVRHLWLQQAVREKKVVLRKVDGKHNPADIVTKGLGILDIEKMLGLMEAFFRHKDLQDKDPEGQFRGVHSPQQFCEGRPLTVGAVAVVGGCWDDRASWFCHGPGYRHPLDPLRSTSAHCGLPQSPCGKSGL